MGLALLLLIMHVNSDVIEPGASLQTLGSGYAFTEGPAVDAHGNVYFTDQPNDRIMRWDVDGKITEWLKPSGRSNGMTFDRHGDLISCADARNELWSIDPNGKVTVLIADHLGKLLNGPNDVWARPDNGLYLTDPLYVRDYWKRTPEMQQPGQCVFFLSAERKILRPVATDLVKPNGIVGTEDGKILYVADIGDDKTYRYKIEQDGTLSGKTLFCSLGSDGMTLDNRGNVYLTGHGVTVYDREGRRIEHIDVPGDWTSNVTFCGADRRTLFITASKCVYGLRMKSHGVQ